ncbi:MAG: sulfite oxidase [Chloroflexi bacterium]|nr:sulfite oxidase [Chloroflexota bacterium]
MLRATIPRKRESLMVHPGLAWNAEPPAGELRQHLVTPTDLFFVRNHGGVPDVDLASYSLAVGGAVKRELHLSMAQVRDRFPRVELCATLECAGNRRRELAEIRPTPGEVLWDQGAIGTALWRGVLLRDVLEAAGVDEAARHVAFTGMDRVDMAEGPATVGGSVPIEKALSDEVILAYEMNGSPLAAVHGFPLRVVVPGFIGARSVKWLQAITLQREPSNNYFQRHAYKLFPPSATACNVDWSKGEVLTRLALNSVICLPRDGEVVQAGEVLVQGYAISGVSKIERVEVSVDNEHGWVTGCLQEGQGPWTWRFWDASLQLEPGPHRLVARAWDALGNTTPADAAERWNFKGYVNNAWHRVRVYAY